MKITGLDWDDYNTNHIAKHNVNPDEVGEICANIHLYRKDPTSKSRGRERYVLSGQTSKSGRYLTVVIERLYGTYFRPVTAFEMSEEYKRKYRDRVRKK